MPQIIIEPGASGGRQPPPMATAVPAVADQQDRVVGVEARAPGVLGLLQGTRERHAERVGRVGEGAQPDLAELRPVLGGHVDDHEPGAQQMP